MQSTLQSTTDQEVAQRSTQRGSVLLIIGAALCFGGQAALLLIERDRSREGLLQAVALALLTAGALAFGLSARRSDAPATPRPTNHPTESDPPRSPHRTWVTAWIAVAVASGLLSVVLFVAKGENSVVVVLWLLGIVAVLASQRRRSQPPSDSKAEARVWELVVLVIVLSVGLASRTYRLAGLPLNVDGDFAAWGIQARALVEGDQERIFAYGWAGIPILGYILPWLTMSLFGTGLVGLNASGVVAGLLIILGMYLTGRELFSARVGLLAAAVMTVSYAHLAASRQSQYIDPALFVLYGCYLLCRGLRRRSGFSVAASGVLIGFALLSYFSGRLGVVIAVVALLHALVFRGDGPRLPYWPIGLWGLSFVLALGPMVAVFASDTESFLARTRQVLLFDPQVMLHMQRVYGVDSVGDTLVEQARHTLLLFHYYADKGTQYGSRVALLDPILAPLFSLGIGYCVFRVRRLGEAVVLAWLALGTITGAFLTANVPFWPRLMVLLPAAALLVALGLNELFDAAMASGLGKGRPAKAVLAVGIAMLFLGVGLANWRSYIQGRAAYATPRTRIARFLAEQPGGSQARLISRYFTFNDREFEFLARGRLISSLRLVRLRGSMPSLGASRLVIVTSESAAILATLERHYPGGTTEAYSGNSPDEVAFYVFRVP